MNPLPSLLPAVVVVPLAVKATLLLAEFNMVKVSGGADTATPWPLTERATKITIVLRQILANQGWKHGGLND